ncbi:efflux RND transporter periplasmic adaptor subunit (plasmid) [Rhizobium rosettiformans]|uniref:Efflux RND transporter periplasmic adaptor subunit n=1 Tax=Rhizobium rosettiformans TaxID=1368430 RepID=A0ABX7F2W7_9HYPH|nr:efflux RND transporter periplasmic adaptor subunit [Rhizobium rosettiformans]QRF54545.1 efflux RND transporter periplasmic adaptor subunit [Rhizobium rosettiformans]
MTARIRNAALWGFAMATALAIGGTLYVQSSSNAEAASTETQATPPAVPVTVTTVQPRPVHVWREVSGRFEAVDRVELRSRVAGAVQSVHFKEGGLVNKGDLLFTIDPEPYQAVVERAHGAVASAEARLVLATTELDRGNALLLRNTISQSEVAQRKSTKASTEAELKSAKAALRLAELDLAYTEIRAPIAGRIGTLEVTPGNLVAAGPSSPSLVTLVSLDPIYASFTIDEGHLRDVLSTLPANDASLLLDQIPVEVDTGTGTAATIPGRLQLINNEIDASTGTIRIRAVFDNHDGRLLPGQFARIRLGQPKAQDRVTISERAVGTDQDKKFVFVVAADNTVSYRQVELGAAVDGQRIVETGLNAGDRIVVSGLQRIRPGAVVAPQEQTALKN